MGMSSTEVSQALEVPRASLRIALAASFTAEPVHDALAFWMEMLALPVGIEFAPYDQVYQQLLDPASLLSRNRRGLNVVLLRPEDWLRALPESAARAGAGVEEILERNSAQLVEAARALAGRSEVPLLLVLCPASQARAGRRDRTLQLDRIRDRIAEALRAVPGISLVTQRDFDPYRVAAYDDPRRDRLGHIPYSPEFFAALATLVARRAHAHLSPPHKVIALDCDNTLWQGVVGEDGVDGIRISPPFAALQRFMVELSERGILLCLCSKNVESDVLEVFDRRPDMILRREHLVSWRINWQPKSENIRSLARELNLGLDSFVFLDDNPLECAELEAACPEVLSLRVPVEGDIGRFLQHVWAFDRTRVTAEDRQRTAMYQQEAERARFQRAAPTIGEFLAGLDLRVTIAPPSAEQVARVAQLTQRTSQFNFTTVRRNEGEVRGLGQSGLECRIVEVRDRFGDYGLVGVMIFGVRGETLLVDTFLLSCRVLGRGVEHRMLRELGGFAQARNLARVTAPIHFTRKNQPARDFLQGIARAYGNTIEGGVRYELPAEFAATLTHRPEVDGDLLPEAVDGAPAEGLTRTVASGEGAAAVKSRRYARIAADLATPKEVLAAVRAHAALQARPATADSAPVPARTPVEAELIAIWTELLRVAPIGIRDDFFDLGGTSLLSVDLCAEIERRLDKTVPLTAVIEAPTIEALALRIGAEGARESLVLIRHGAGRTPVFLIHDGDGETLLYRSLALRLDAGHAVYGLQPYSLERAPMAHTRISDMATYHIAKMRTVQPSGPYVLGGMCAGGVIAYEVARQLRSQGEQVALVALLDAADPNAALRAWKVTQERLRRSLGVFREAQSASPLRRPLIILQRLLQKGRNLTVYVIQDRSRRLWDGFRLGVFRAFAQRGRPPPRSLGTISVRTTYLFAERNYRPESAFDGELVLFRATGGAGSDEPYVERYQDPLLGWGPRATRGVRAIDVPGGHASMLQEPYVDVLAGEMQSAIDAALGEESEPVAAQIA